MEVEKSFLSETAIWKTVSEFVDPTGQIFIGEGESNVIVNGKSIANRSWLTVLGTKLENNYSITQISQNRYQFIAHKPHSGIETGFMDIDRNIVYTKFVIEDSELNGFETIARKGDTCDISGALYDGDKLINTWTAKMIKI